MAHFVIEIDTPNVFEIVKKLDPSYAELEYEDAHETFFILDWPTFGVHTIVRPEQLREFTLESTVPIKTWRLKKD